MGIIEGFWNLQNNMYNTSVNVSVIHSAQRLIWVPTPVIQHTSGITHNYSSNTMQ